MAGVRVEVVYARADEQQVVLVEVEQGTTAIAAVEVSGIRFDARKVRLGRFGREIPPDEPVSEGDRIEILRPLRLTPMEARRLRARKPRAR